MRVTSKEMRCTAFIRAGWAGLAGWAGWAGETREYPYGINIKITSHDAVLIRQQEGYECREMRRGSQLSRTMTYN
eukprot:9129659-Karenia_brevis.AAC.1